MSPETVIYTGTPAQLPRAKIDPALAAQANRLDYMPVYRFFVAMHEYLYRFHNGRGMFSESDLDAALAYFHIEYTEKNIGYLLESGEGIFWHTRHDGRKVLRSAAYARRKLDKKLHYITGDLNELHLYKPVRFPVEIELAGTLQLFKARCYSGWLEAFNFRTGKVKASRVFIGHIWGVSKNTLRQWEKLTWVKKTPNFAQYAGDNPKMQLPEYARLIALKNGRVAAGWQLPHTYEAGVNAPQRAAGQQIKIHKRRQAFISRLQPLAKCGEGALPDTGRIYYDNQKTPRDGFSAALKAMRKGFQPGQHRYIRLGERRNGIGIYEVYDMGTDLQHTELESRDHKGERTREFLTLRFASEDIGITRNLLKQVWKKTEPSYSVAVLQPHDSVLSATIASDPVLSLSAELGAEISLKTTKKDTVRGGASRRSTPTTAQAGGGSNLSSTNAAPAIVLHHALKNQIALMRHVKSIPTKTYNHFLQELTAAGYKLERLQAVQRLLGVYQANRQGWASNGK